MTIRNTALLLVVDAQNSFTNDYTRQVLSPINELINHWRSKSSIVFSRFVNPDRGPWEKLRNWGECKTEPDILLHPELNKGKDLVVDKHTYSAWGDDVVQFTCHGDLTRWCYAVLTLTSVCWLRQSMCSIMVSGL